MTIFVDKLREKQGTRSLRALAREIGVSPASLSLFYRGITRRSPTVIFAAINRYPDLTYWLGQDASSPGTTNPAAAVGSPTS